MCDLQVVLLFPDRIEVSIDSLGSLLGLSHLNGNIWIAGSCLVLCLKTLGTKDYREEGKTKTFGITIKKNQMKQMRMMLKVNDVVEFNNFLSVSPVMVILADHFEVPSSTLCLMVFICCAWMALLMMNTSLISSKISGLFLSRIFILSFMAMIIF